MSLHGVSFEGANWWLRDVVNASNFANVNNNGNANNNNASNSNGIRPDYDAANFLVLGCGISKGKGIPAEWLNDSAKSGAAVCRFALCGKIRQANTRGLTR